MDARQHPLYQIWKGMRARCYNPNHDSYHRYGGRGILVEDEWNDYLKFYAWSLYNGYKDGLSLDRMDNDGNYSSKNCRWTTYIQQANNTSTNVHLTAFGETKTVAEWADDIRCAVPLNTLYQRVENNWMHEDAIITPSQRRSTQRPLTFDWYQAVAETTAIYPDKGTLGGLSYAALGLSSEVGELCGKLKKVMRDHGGQVTPEFRHNLTSELSDVLWYCAAIASELNISLGKIAQDNLDKLASRQDRGTLGGSGDNR